MKFNNFPDLFLDLSLLEEYHPLFAINVVAHHRVQKLNAPAIAHNHIIAVDLVH